MNLPMLPANQQPRYEGQGWTHWPDHPELSLQFLRALGAAQEGAGTISECFLTASRMVPGDLESWYQEWQRVAEVNVQRACAALSGGHLHTAKTNFLRASSYFRSSELFLEPNDPRREETFQKILANSHAYLGLISPVGEILSVDVGDGTMLDAYFLKPSSDATSWPTIICFGGLDGCKDELLPKMPRYALSRGMALLLVDMPGQGGTLRRRFTVNRPDTEVPVGQCVDFLLTRGDVDRGRIALYGASMGGIYSARAASVERRIKAVVSDSLTFDVHAEMQRRLRQPDASMWTHLKWVYGCGTPEEVVEKSRDFRMADFIGKIECPYLIVQGEHDFLGLQTAVDAFHFAKASGVPVELKVFDAEETGASHCQADNPALGQEFICDWIAEKLDIKQSISGL